MTNYPPTATRLSAKRALVTGGSRGIGRAVALSLAAAGADVAISDLDLRSFEQFPLEHQELTADSVAAEITALGRRSLEIQADATDSDRMRAVFETLDERWGGIDILINNAGGATLSDGEDTTASTATLESLDANLNRNLRSTILGCQLAVPRMRAAGGGAIVNLASQAAYKWDSKPYAFYGAAKAAIVTYTKYLAHEVGPHGIRVNAVAPGFIGTGRMLPMFEERGIDQIQQRVALGRLGSAQECADVITYLAGDTSSYVNGQVIKITGGPYV